MVYGSVAVDISCDYDPLGVDAPISPQMHTSNPAALTQSIGGVGRNVALAAHRAGGNKEVLLRSLVAKDLYVASEPHLLITNYVVGQGRPFWMLL